MAHPSLLPTVCAYTTYCDDGSFENYCVCDYEQRTCVAGIRVGQCGRKAPYSRLECLMRKGVIFIPSESSAT